MSGTRTLKDLLASIPQNAESKPSMLCVANGILSSKPILEALPPNSSVDDILRTGTYRVTDSITGLPAGVTALGCIIRHIIWDENRRYQVVLTKNEVLFRVYSAGAWLPWREVAAAVWGGGKTLYFSALPACERRCAA